MRLAIGDGNNTSMTIEQEVDAVSRALYGVVLERGRKQDWLHHPARLLTDAAAKMVEHGCEEAVIRQVIDVARGVVLTSDEWWQRFDEWLGD